MMDYPNTERHTFTYNRRYVSKVDHFPHPPANAREITCSHDEELIARWVDHRAAEGETSAEIFLDCVTLLAFRDPVVADDGNTYERSALLMAWWSQDKNMVKVRSPLTNLKVDNPMTYDNRFVLKAMREWVNRDLKLEPFANPTNEIVHRLGLDKDACYARTNSVVAQSSSSTTNHVMRHDSEIILTQAVNDAIDDAMEAVD